MTRSPNLLLLLLIVASILIVGVKAAVDNVTTDLPKTITRTDPALIRQILNSRDGCCPRSRTTITVTLTETTTTSLPVSFSLLLTDSTTIRYYETTSINITRTSLLVVTSRVTTISTTTVTEENYSTSLVSRFFTRQSRVTFQSVATKRVYTTVTSFRVSVRTRQLTEYQTVSLETVITSVNYGTTTTTPITVFIPSGTTTTISTSYFFDYLTIYGTQTTVRPFFGKSYVLTKTKTTTLNFILPVISYDFFDYGFATTLYPTTTYTLTGSLTYSPSVTIVTGPITDTLSVSTTWTYSYLPPP